MQAEHAVDVGERIKTLREEKRMSLRVLSKKSGISANALSLIERSKTSPTVTTLVAVARAFGLSVNDFFVDSEREKDGFIVYKRSEGAGENPTQAMAANLKNQNLNPMLVRLAHNQKFRKDLCFHPGDEFVYCLSGEVECEIDTSKIRLTPGDAITYKAEIPHRIKGISPTGSDVLVVFEMARLT
jgi:transcriptional regulator with XRE-family HTH domain